MWSYLLKWSLYIHLLFNSVSCVFSSSKEFHMEPASNTHLFLTGIGHYRDNSITTRTRSKQRHISCSNCCHEWMRNGIPKGCVYEVYIRVAFSVHSSQTYYSMEWLEFCSNTNTKWTLQACIHNDQRYNIAEYDRGLRPVKRPEKIIEVAIDVTIRQVSYTSSRIIMWWQIFQQFSTS